MVVRATAVSSLLWGLALVWAPTATATRAPTRTAAAGGAAHELSRLGARLVRLLLRAGVPPALFYALVAAGVLAVVVAGRARR